MRTQVAVYSHILTPAITPAALDLERFLNHPYPYSEGLVQIIQPGLGSVRVESYLEVLAHADKTIKIEGMERYSPTLAHACAQLRVFFDHQGPITCHLFQAEAGAASFPAHRDLDDVFIYCVSGVKTMLVEDKTYHLNPGMGLYIPHKVEHRARNDAGALTLSFGLEHYLCEKLHER